MFHSATLGSKETLDSHAPSGEKSKSDPVNQGNLKGWFETFTFWFKCCLTAGVVTLFSVLHICVFPPVEEQTRFMHFPFSHACD